MAGVFLSACVALLHDRETREDDTNRTRRDFGGERETTTLKIGQHLTGTLMQ